MKILENIYSDEKMIKLFNKDFLKFDTDKIKKDIDSLKDVANIYNYLSYLKKDIEVLLKDNEYILREPNTRQLQDISNSLFEIKIKKTLSGTPINKDQSDFIEYALEKLETQRGYLTTEELQKLAKLTSEEAKNEYALEYVFNVNKLCKYDFFLVPIYEFINKELNFCKDQLIIQKQNTFKEKKQIQDKPSPIKLIWYGTENKLATLLNLLIENDFITNCNNINSYIANFINTSQKPFTDKEPMNIIWLGLQSELVYIIKELYHKDINLISNKFIWEIVTCIFRNKSKDITFNKTSLTKQSNTAKPIKKNMIEKLVKSVKSVNK